MNNGRLIHTAQALVDDVINIPFLPRRGANAVATARNQRAGGAVTVLLAAARSGARCVHAGSVGTGPAGDLIRSVLQGDGVAVSSPVVDEIDSGVCMVFVEPSAERTFVTVQGAERRISIASLNTSVPRPGDFVAISGYTLQGQTATPLLGWLDTLPPGVEVVLDPGEAFAELDDETRGAALAHTTIWTSNADEAKFMTGSHGMAKAAEMLLGLLRPGALAIVRDGPTGCAVSGWGQTTVIPGFPQTPYDTNGAGDTHTGVMMAELLSGAKPAVAARRANAAGALKVIQRGADTIPAAADIDAFLAAQ
ncbi:MAG: PfkB family carbohydrate kinase [Propionibacteriaceae bacterium]|nr:PfkB family carbohydrate kinase [Propionibacteriaceae bacterium]